MGFCHSQRYSYRWSIIRIIETLFLSLKHYSYRWSIIRITESFPKKIITTIMVTDDFYAHFLIGRFSALLSFLSVLWTLFFLSHTSLYTFYSRLNSLIFFALFFTSYKNTCCFETLFYILFFIRVCFLWMAFNFRLRSVIISINNLLLMSILLW